MSEAGVRIRGIYATALTALLEADARIVQATPPIRERFATDFPTAEHAVAIETTTDRLGVGLHGSPDDVATLRARLADVAIDTLAWSEPAPAGSVVDAEVTETLGSGAVVNLGPREGFLPYDAADAHVSVGDEPTVQVLEPAPPWSDRRHEVGEQLRVTGGLATLVRGLGSTQADVPDQGRAEELVRSTDLLEATPPEGWGVRWEQSAAEADLETLDEALAAAVDRADSLLAHLDGADPPAATTWVRFGRASRFALDDCRREVTPTMAGHHRIKAAGGAASAAVDLVERLDASVADGADGFPFAAVADTFGPSIGDTVSIHHGKPDGRRFSLGRGEVADRDGEAVTVHRRIRSDGEYDALGVPRESGDLAVTKLVEGRWWYPTDYRDAEGATKGTYVNVCTPVEVFPDTVTYVDLHVDVVRHPDGTVERVDDDELDAAEEAGRVTPALARKAREVAAAVERALA